MKKLNRGHKIVRWLVLCLITTSLIGCGGDGERPSPLSDGVAKLDSNSGGVVAISASSSPIYGAKVVFDTDALDGTEQVTIGYEDNLPAPLNSDAVALGGKAISKVLVLTRTGSADFGKAAAVTIPYDKAALSANAIPIVVTWDESTKTYSPVTVRTVDRTNGTITFMTAHFSRYVVIVLDKLFGTTPPATTTLTTDTGFKPEVDGFFDHNFGSYDRPGGNCFGMASYSAWYFSMRKAGLINNAGLFSLYQEGTPQEEDDQKARELIVRAYQAGEPKAHIASLDWVNNDVLLPREWRDRSVAYSLLQQMMVTKQPQIMAMGIGSFFNWTKGHAVTVYAYDGKTGLFSFYDNNFPKEVQTLPWDPKTGFGSYTHKNNTWDVFGFASFNQAYSQATLTKLYNDAESGWSESEFPKITITNPNGSSTVADVYEVAKEENVTVIGSVPRGKNAAHKNSQRYLHVYLNGTHFGAAVQVSNTNDTFSFNIPKLPTPTGTTVMLLVSESPNSWNGVFTSFKQFKLRVANQYFFKNMGFETGDFSSWANERHLWGQAPGAVTPSDKASIVSKPALDPIATDIPVSFYGEHAARINNSDDSYHISTLSQTAVVPKGSNPTLRFYWAAVLEDPQHDPADQPYVKVTVANKTKGITLYEKRYYANDSSYTGWKSYQSGQWKAIPWQPVELPMIQYVGDTIQLTVEAADCAQGAHGGYAYLDAEE